MDAKLSKVCNYFPKNVEFKKLITKYNLRINHDRVKFNTKLHVIIYWSLWTFCNKCQNLQVIPLWQYLSPKCFPDLRCHTMWWNLFWRSILILIIVHLKKYNFNLCTTVKGNKIHNIFSILLYWQKLGPQIARRTAQLVPFSNWKYALNSINL